MEAVVNIINKMFLPVILQKVPTTIQKVLDLFSNTDLVITHKVFDKDMQVKLFFPMGIQTFQEKNILILPVNIVYVKAVDTGI